MSKPLTVPATINEHGAASLSMERSHYQALLKARFAGRDVDIEVRLHREKRSIRANDALHAGLYEWAAYKGLAGRVAEQWVEDMKDDLLGLCWGYIVRQNQLTGEITKRLVKEHTSELSVEEFCELFDVGIVKAAEDGHVWRLPEEFKRTAA